MIRSLVDAAAGSEIDPQIILAVIVQESQGNQWAVRFEPKFYERKLQHLGRSDLAGYVPGLLPTLATEKTLRATSWGLMQIMGETARVVGFKDPYLSRLLDPALNISIGTKYLKMLLSRKNGDTRAALLAYNGGGDPLYPDRVIEHIATGRISSIG